MHQLMRFFLLVAVIIYCHGDQGADKYTDENRPYEFGFTIDGEQHRHEKKDENGIIMGEFGFITADGVYHVTVYATDENGNFKIISMKNIRVKPYPTSPEITAPPKRQSPVVQGPSSQQPAKPLPAIGPPSKSCSHCSVPTTSTQTPRITDLAGAVRDPLPSSVLGTNPASRPQHPQVANEYQNSPNHQTSRPDQIASGDPSIYLQGPNDTPNYPQQQASIGTNYPQRGQDYPQQGQGAPQSRPVYPQPGSNYPQEGPNNPQFEQNSPSLNAPQNLEQNLQPPHRHPKQIESRFGETDQQSNQGEQGRPTKPQLISAQMQIVDKNTDVNYRAPGEKEGLPNGLTKDDMTTLLYTFNYTVGFHGHHEEGYTNGAKKGYYYITGRNGVRTRVDYVADENGFRPKITQEVLDLLSDDVPKPETEKDEKFGLKGYEFKWLYYPPAEQKTRLS